MLRQAQHDNLNPISPLYRGELNFLLPQDLLFCLFSRDYSLLANNKSYYNLSPASRWLVAS